MVCIYCGHATQVFNSRPQKRLNQVWRRRHCSSCGATFSTHEITAYDDAWRVKLANGQLVPFAKNNLLISLYKSVEHREHAVADATALTDTIIGLLRQQTDVGVLEATQIAVTSHTVLENFDTAAAMYYQARHNF